MISIVVNFMTASYHELTSEENKESEGWKEEQLCLAVGENYGSFKHHMTRWD